ncbi:MAG: hypothetical protein ACREVK_12480 [Gammaproteobacteria bacterium]
MATGNFTQDDSKTDSPFEDLDVVDRVSEHLAKASGIVMVVMEVLREGDKGKGAEVNALWAVEGYLEDALGLINEAHDARRSAPR